jgi:hypothetical protein
LFITTTSTIHAMIVHDVFSTRSKYPRAYPRPLLTKPSLNGDERVRQSSSSAQGYFDKIMAAQASVLLWANDCLKDANETEKEGLEAVRRSSNTAAVPLIAVESKKQLGEWVGVRVFSLECACQQAACGQENVAHCYFLCLGTLSGQIASSCMSDLALQFHLCAYNPSLLPNRTHCHRCPHWNIQLQYEFSDGDEEDIIGAARQDWPVEESSNLFAGRGA